jgi:PBP1b-binding outer membrane lipoprotein LpoB
MKNAFLTISFYLIFLLLAGCMSAGEHRQAVSSDEADRVTVGKVQREIRVGMASAEVIEALGSPNIVTTDGGDTAGGGGVLPSFSKSTGASSTTQRTLTIIIKFDEENKVRDFAYRQSTF